MLRSAFLLIIFAVISAVANAEPVFPPGLRVGLEPAGDLKPGASIAGFRDSERKVAVTIAELPTAAYDQLSRTMFGSAPAGATDVTRELFAFRDGVGYLHTARIIENGVAARRWLLLAVLTGLKQDFVAVVNVNVPESESSIYSDAVVRGMLASITVRKAPIEEQLGLIPFKLEDLAGFRVMQVTPGSVLLIDGPEDDIGRYAYAVISIGSAAPKELDDHPRFSRNLLSTTPFRELTLQSADEMRIGSRPGFEIRARGKDPRGNAVSVVQWVRFMGGSFIRILGVSPAEQWDQMFNRLRAVRDGVALR